MMHMTEVDSLRGLDERTFTFYNAELTRRQKGVGIAYALWFFFGLLGVHKFYIGKRGWGIAYLVATGLVWSAAGSVFAGVSAHRSASALDGLLFVLAGVSIVFLAVAMVVDLFTLPRQVEHANDATRAELLHRLRQLTAPVEDAPDTDALTE